MKRLASPRSHLVVLLVALFGALAPSACDPAPQAAPPSATATPTPTPTAAPTPTPTATPPGTPTPTAPPAASESLDAGFPGLAQVPAGEEREAAENTIRLILADGPFPYPEKDGSVFGNFEGRLPKQTRGHYREYTVPTPGLSHRGARRVVAGRTGEMFYTRDHYETFRRLTP